MQEGLLPGGRILANAGARGPNPPTLANCFVHPLAAGALGLKQTLQEVGRTLRQGGGVGLSLNACQGRATGHETGLPLSEVLLAFEALAHDIESAGGRPAALMGTLSVDHPGALELIEVKRIHPMPHFNLSLALTDAFMRCLRHSSAALSLWMTLSRSTLEQGDPGVLFIDTIRRNDNLGDHETLEACNPCGEQPLPEWGACVLASIDLTRLVQSPFSPAARIDLDRLRGLSRTGVALLDQAIDRGAFPWPQQTRLAQSQRRIGLGLLGLGDALIMLGLRYDSSAGRALAAELMREIQCAAWETSIMRARRFGPNGACPGAHLLQPGHSASRLPVELQADLRRHGARNTHLTSIAPTGTLALAWADNASPGVEPVFTHDGDRNRRDAHGVLRSMGVSSPALRLWRAQAAWHADVLRSGDTRSGDTRSEPYPVAWQTIETLSPTAQIAMVAALQPWVDGGISKTLAMGPNASPGEVANALRLAWRCGLKGLAVYKMPTRACG